MNYKDTALDPYVDPINLKIANNQHDEELRLAHITIEGRVRGSWNPEKLSRRGLLTDKMIAAYEKAGYYSPEFKEARRKLMQRNVARIKMTRATETFTERKGNFIERDGRLIYSP